MPVSKCKTSLATRNNKQLARKVAACFEHTFTIKVMGTGSVYLYIRFRYCQEYTANHQLIVRFSDHISYRQLPDCDIDVIVNPDRLIDDIIADVKQDILAFIESDRKHYEEQKRQHS